MHEQIYADHLDAESAELEEQIEAELNMFESNPGTFNNFLLFFPPYRIVNPNAGLQELYDLIDVVLLDMPITAKKLYGSTFEVGADDAHKAKTALLLPVYKDLRLRGLSRTDLQA